MFSSTNSKLLVIKRPTNDSTACISTTTSINRPIAGSKSNCKIIKLNSFQEMRPHPKWESCSVVLNISDTDSHEGSLHFSEEDEEFDCLKDEIRLSDSFKTLNEEELGRENISVSIILKNDLEISRDLPCDNKLTQEEIVSHKPIKLKSNKIIRYEGIPAELAGETQGNSKCKQNELLKQSSSKLELVYLNLLKSSRLRKANLKKFNRCSCL